MAKKPEKSSKPKKKASTAPALFEGNEPGYKFPNGHVVGSSGIARPTKFANRVKKQANRHANLSARAATNSARANDPRGKPNWHGAINGTPATAGAKKR